MAANGRIWRLYESRSWWTFRSICRTLWNTRTAINSRPFASITSLKYTEDKVVVTDNGSVIVCWHPENTVPYELTRPLPEVQEEDSTVLRVAKDVALNRIMKRKTDEQVRQELMKITHTTKHRWFPKSEKYKREKHHDREYL
ncbi:hypothetical protein R5R35_013559 [Gryllus longicercus]|uniref:Large ribosomal subunit protein mL42 n=1 Tax=Gryllus longicercus TaxID=2509291 RepID=A0AAN9VZA1_9ORTH